MRKALCLFLSLLLLAVSALDASTMSKRKKRKKTNSPFVGNLIMPRGPQYSQPDAPPPPSEIPNLIAASNPNSPNQIAAQALGIQGGSGTCDKSAITRLNAITAELNAITAKIQALAVQQQGCGLNLGCHAAIVNQATVLSNQAAVLAAQAMALAPAVAEAQRCASSGASSVQAQIPGVTMASVAKRFNITIPNAPGQNGGNAAPQGGSALQQLEELAEAGEDADWDGRKKRKDGRRASSPMNVYTQAARRVAAMHARVGMGRQFAAKMPSFDDPGQLAQAEYLKINYKELGPKYEALVQERHQAAENVAQSTLVGLGPNAPLPDPDMQPMIQLDESKAINLGGAGAWVDKASESMQEGMKDALLEKLPVQWQSLEKIAEINLAVAKAWDLRDDLLAAVNEMGSASMSTASTESMLAKLDEYFGEVKDATFEKNPFKLLLGAD